MIIRNMNRVLVFNNAWVFSDTVLVDIYRFHEQQTKHRHDVCYSVFIVSELLTNDYTETYYREDGSRVTTAPNDIVSIFILRLISLPQLNLTHASVCSSMCEWIYMIVQWKCPPFHAGDMLSMYYPQWPSLKG